MIPKAMRSKAELAGEWYLRKCCECVITRKAIRTKFQCVDFFCSDVVGKRKDGSHVYAQITTGGEEAVRQRRRKLETIPWHPSDTVYLLQLIDGGNRGRSKVWTFRVFEIIGKIWVEVSGGAVGDDNYEIPRNWFTKYKEE